MSGTRMAARQRGMVSRELAKDRLGVPSVLFFVMASVAPLTVAAGVVPTAYAVTGLIGIPVGFIAIAIILALFATGYVAMTRHITNAGAFYAFISRGMGRVFGVAAALIALLSYTFLQVGHYGAFGPTARGEAITYLHVNWPWWTWALIAWAIVTILGLLRVDVTGKVLGIFCTAEVIVIVVLTVSGLIQPAHGKLSFATLEPSALAKSGFGTFGVLAVVAILGFIGFEQAPVLAEEARNPRRTVPIATYFALGMICVVYAASSWAMAAFAGDGKVVGDAQQMPPGQLLFGMGSHGLSVLGSLLFMTSLFAAALSFHNCVWRYIFALGREGVLPAFLGRTGPNSIPKAASLAQSVTALIAIVVFAVGKWDPFTHLFFWLGTTGGFGVLILLALTSVAIIAFFRANHRGESAWHRIIAPGASVVLLTGIVVLAVQHYDILLGVAHGSAVAWILPATYAVVAVIGLIWGATLRATRPEVYASVGLGANAVTGQLTPASHRAP